MSAFESTLQKSVLKYLKERGYFAINVPGNAFSSGTPDILSCVRGLWVALELKSADGSLRPLQKVNIKLIRRAGGIAEAIRSIERVREIIETIEQDRTWEPQAF
jgi:Holliday junction resolvase